MSGVSFTKVAIVGAGAIGGWMGVHLARAGAQVSVLARGVTLAALQSEGLQLHQGGELHIVPVKASNQAADLGMQDLVVISVKAPALSAVAAQVRPLIGPNTVVLTAMNGVPWWFLQGFGGPVAGRSLASVDPEGQIARALPAQHIIGCVVHASCSVDAPGVIRHHFGDGLIVGEPSGELTPRVQALHALLQQAGFNATLSPQIQKDIWYKLWGNMTVNPVSALTGATTDRILDDELVRGFISHVMREAKAIGECIGIPIAGARRPTCGHTKIGGLQNVHAARRAGGQTGGARCPGQRGARAGAAHGGGHAIHRRTAGSESPACQGTGALPRTMKT